MGVVYESVSDYEATAGVGQFNSSYVSEYIGNLQAREGEYPYTIVPYWMQAIVNNLVTSPMHSVASEPVTACDGHDCDSYLLPGGLVNSSPWVPTDHPSAPAIQIANVSSIQLDFRRETSQQDLFKTGDCNIYGAETSWVGIRFCVSTSHKVNGSFAAGLYVCPGGAWNDTCRLGSSSFYPNITTTFSVFSRKTTFIAARSNMSLISITSAGPPTQNTALDLEGFQAAIRWILDFNAANIPGPTSIAQQFFSGKGQLQNAYWSPILTQTFHSVLAFPFWFFNPNNLGNIEGYGTSITPNLPPEFYTTASVVTPHSRILISPVMFSTFITLQAILHVSIWAAFVWLVLPRPPSLPEITSYPLFNFAFKTRLKRDTAGMSTGKCQIYQRLSQGGPPAKVILAARDGDVLSMLEHCTITLRSNNEVLPLIGNKSQQSLPVQPSTRPSTW
ncbi:hypothetical protein BJX62DRAFT_234763 [Aspergillus germanicus]